MAPKRRPIKTRLLEKMIATDSGCWEWTGSFGGDGYGVISVGRNKQYRVHRLAYEIFKGSSPGEYMVCHKCDNPKCFNPDHLFLGTAKENTSDMIKKGRAFIALGSVHPNSKVTEEDVLAIRAERANVATLTAISVAYGITFQHVSNICRGKTWKHV